MASSILASGTGRSCPMADLSTSPSAVTTAAPTSRSAPATRVRRSRFWEFVRTQRLAAIALVLIVLFVVAAILAPLIAPYGPTEQIRTAIMQPPGGQYLFGTDD